MSNLNDVQRDIILEIMVKQGVDDRGLAYPLLDRLAMESKTIQEFEKKLATLAKEFEAAKKIVSDLAKVM